MGVLFYSLTYCWFITLFITLSKVSFVESVSITLEPDNPTQVLVNSEVVLRWNYTLGGDRFREVEFRRTRTGADEKIGLIDRDVFLYLAFQSGRFEVQAPATLVIRNVTADDATDYILTVEAKTSSDIVTAESSITLDVLLPVNFTTVPSNKTANETDAVTFLCSASGNPVPTIIWLKDGQTVGNQTPLTFTVFRNHSGNYSCFADNGLNVTVTASAYLDVQFMPENTQLSVGSLNTSAVLLGSTVTFNCSTSSYPSPHVYWFYHNEVFIGSNVSGFYNLKMSRSGVYSCLPVNRAGVGETATVNLTVVDLPRVSVSPASLIILEGINNATLTCNATGIPSPVITWSLISTAGASILSQSAVLNLFNISRPGTPTEELHYHCTASNGIGNPAIDNVTITVHYPSKIDQAPSNKTIVEGSNVTLHCNATGSPASNITWTKDGSPTALHEGEQYAISNISRQQHGNYKCTAWNGVGEQSKTSFNINVLYEPAISIHKCPSPITEGSNTTLYCNATGNPVPVVSWIYQETGVIVSSTEELVFTSIDRSQAGSYKCHAFNGIGSNSTRKCSLDVFYLPLGTSIEMTPSNTTVLRSSTVTLNCSTDANPAAHVYQFYFNDSFISNSSSGLLNITVDTDGVYTCVPINKVGTGHNANVSITMVDAPSADVYLTSSVVVEGQNVTLSCNASGKPYPRLTWTKVGGLGQVLSQTSTLIVNNVSRTVTANNLNQYQCTADNGVGRPATAVANVTVHFPPEFVSTPSSRQLVEGSGALLYCNATGNPEPNITWTKGGNEILLSTSEILNLTSVPRGDNGAVYTCKGQNYLGLVKATAIITVFYAPMVAIQLCSSPVTEGDNVTFYCNATGNPSPNITWTRANSSAVISFSEMFHMEAVKRNESGSYVCHASNGFGTHNTSCSVDVQYQPTDTALTTAPTNTTALRGSPMSLNCVTDANPAAHVYQFYLNDSFISNCSSGVLNITVGTDGVYTCVPINKVGTGHNATVSIIMVVAPSIDISNTMLIAVEGSNVTLSCNASGKPPPIITWTRIGDPKVFPQGSSISVVNVTRPGTPDNMIQYQCTASNGVRSPAKAVANITVHYPPTSTGLTTSLVNTTVLWGSIVSLNCSTDANPAAYMYQFYFNDAIIGNHSSGLLNITVDADGVCTCVPINTVGTGHNATVSITMVVAPLVKISDTILTIVEGSNVTLSCNASGKPSPIITWTRVGDSKVFPQGSSITVLNVSRPGTPDNIIRYQCTASNGVESPVKAIAKVTVHYQPKILSAPSSQQVVEGNGAILFCNATGYPEPNITWTKQGNEIVLSTLQVLNLTSLMREDNGAVYTCIVQNYLATVKASAMVTVFYAPTATIQQFTSPITESDNVTLYCNASGNPMPNITWTGPYTSAVLSYSNILLVEAIKRNASGSYVCRASSSFGMDNTSCNIDVQYQPTGTALTTTPTNTTVLCGSTVLLNCSTDANPAAHMYQLYVNDAIIGNSSDGLFNITVNADGAYTCVPINKVDTGSNVTVNFTVVVAPTIEISNTVLIAVEGGNLSLSCNASGKPAPVITWIQVGDSEALAQGSSISVVNITRPGTPDSMIQYQCTASNGVESPAKAVANVTVHYPPEIVSTPSLQQDLYEGSGTVLLCNVTGNPQPNISWTKQGNDSVLLTLQTLNLTVLKRVDNGAVYKCKVQNYLGLMETTVMISVLYAPTATIQQCSTPVTEGNNATLYCNATGNPAPNITWIRKSTRQVVSANKVLVIEAIKSNGSGSYECLAWNGIGNNSTNSCTVDVYYTPTGTAVTADPTNTTVLRGSTVLLNCSADANPLAYLYQFYLNDTIIGNSSSGVFNITVDADGVYTCVPVNQVGTGQSAMVRVTAVVGPAVRVFPQTVTVVEGDNIFLTCNTSGIPSPLIRWVRIGQSGVVSQNSSLTVVNVSRPGTPDSMVQYQCTASNGVGSPAVDVANVTVHHAPEIVVAPFNTTTIEGRSAILFCNATGSPKPNVTWSKGGSNTTLSSSEELILGNLTRSHSGTKYKCIITNYLGSVEASAIVTVYYPAVVAYSPLNQTVLEGTNVTLHCNASGKPTPNITWTKDGSQAVLFQGDIYGFVNVQRLNAGDYTCTAWNGVGRQSNATATVNVQYESVIDKGPFNRTVVEGDNITFSCNATGNPTPNITWTKVGSSRVLYQGKTYSIYKIQRETAGDYACTAWNGVGKKSHASATVIVHYGSTIDQKISSVVVIEGNNVTIKCNATGNPPPNITWIKDISPLVFYQGESYDIVNIDRNSAGDYTCTAWNGVGEKANATAAVTVHYESAIDLALSNITVVEGDNVTLHCNATGIPTPNITWTKDSNLTVIHQGETYNIADIERKAAGDYTCRAWNGVGKQANATASVTVHYKSVLDMSLSNVTAVEGDNVTLRCNATGNPAPNITWNKKGNPEVLYQGETYSIVNIRRMAGGDYSCTAWNGVGDKVSASASVTVHYPPSISGLPPNTVIQEGKNVTLYCNVTGNPSPKITWTKDGSVKVLSEAERFIILNVTRQQAGDYVCTARNGMETSANTTLMLTVHYPSSVGTRPINQAVMEGQNVTLHCNATGNPAPNITWTKDGNAVVLYQGETYTIYNIQREAAGGYTCTAWNGVDDQTNATTSITVYYPAVIHQAPSNQTVLEYSNITLFCNATSNPPSNIVWTQNENSTILHQGNAFIIRNVTRNFNGKRYKCTTENNVTEDAYSYAVVTVLYPPEVSVMSPNRVLEGDNLSLICNVSGNPHPNVAWVRASDNSVLINDSNALLKNINRTESGVFHCLAWNGIGTNASSNISIDVLYPPEIVTPPVDQVVWVGQQVNLSCDAVGNPTPKIFYTVIGDNGIVGFEKTLVINSSSTPYMKMFTCNANNTIGPVAAANATITVLARPCAQNPCLRGSCTDVNIGTYLCNCSYGYQGANCDQAIPPKTDVVDGLITLKKDRYIYHPDYQNHSSAMFTELSSRFCENVTVLFQGEPQFGHCKVNDIINGSVVVNFTLVFIRGNKYVDNLLQVLKESVDNGSVLAIPVERETLHLILPSTTAPPTTVQVLPPSVAARKKSMSPWIIAVLAAIGGLVFLVFICAIIHCCVLRKRKVKKRGICQRYEESTGKWIDLPQVGDGKGSDEVYGYTGPGAYIHEGPTVRVPANQENGYHSGIYERTPDEPKPSVVQFSDKANGASTEF